MPQELYDRRAAVTIGIPGAGGVRVEDLRVGFRVSKTVKSSANTAEVKLYNLSEATRGRFHAREDAVIVEAGYVGLTEVLFKGWITRVGHEQQGPEWVTTIESGDGTREFKQSRISRTFPAGTKVDDLLKDVVELLGTSKGDLVKDLSALVSKLVADGGPATLPRAFSASGSTKDVLDQLSRSMRFDWSIQDDVAQVVHEDLAVRGSAYVLEPPILIGSPVPIVATRTKKGKVKGVDGFKFRSLLIPSLRPGMLLSVKSVALTAVGRIESVTFVGDTHADDWTAEGEAKTLPGVSL